MRPAFERASSSVAKITLTFLAVRGAFFAFVYAVVSLVAMREANPYPALNAFPESPFWDAFVRWDSGWYANIIRNGYFRGIGQSNVAFFPAYPTLSKHLAPLFGDSFWAAGLFISNLSLYGGLLALHRLVRLDADERAADRAVLFVLVFPATIFFSAFYTESLFFFLVTASLLSFRTDRVFLACLLGGAAALTRASGALLAPAYFLAIATRLRFDPRRIQRSDLLALACLALIPLGTAVFAYHLEQKVGDPLAFVHVQAAWGRRSLELPWTTIYQELHPQRDFYRHIECGAAACVLVASLVAPSMLRAEQSTFLLLSVLMPLSTGTTESMLRYSATMIPIYPLLARATKHPIAERAVVVASTLLAALTAVRFVTWFWAG